MNIIAQKFDTIYSVIKLYKSFDKYKYTQNEELFFYLLTTFETKQYKIFYTGSEVTGFVSWCYLDKYSENHFKKTGEVLHWNCGNIIWLVDVLSTKDIQLIVKWIKNYFASRIQVNERVNYVRMDNEFNIYRISSQSNKEFYKNG